MLIISFFTKDTIYEKEIEDLIFSCKALKIEYYIEARPCLGKWEKNCNQKPLFILECLEKFNQPLLWVDADGIVLQKPINHFDGFDLGLYFNENQWARNGTIFVAPTQKAKDFMRLWYETAVEENHARADQQVMNDLFSKAPGLKIAPLPIEYVQVFDRDPIAIEKTVILHSQASRTALMDRMFWQHLTGKQLKEIRISNSSSKSENN